MLLYVVVLLVGMSLYGVEAWTRNADALRRLLQPVRVASRRSPAATARCTCARRWSARRLLEPRTGTVAVLLTALGSTAFDGAKEGPLFNDVLPNLQDVLRRTSACGGAALERGFVLGLLVAIALRVADLGARDPGMPRLRGVRAASRAPLVHSLVPILAAYVVAHYFSLFVYNGQDALAAGVATRSGTARTCSAAPAARSTTGWSPRRRSGTCRSASLVAGHVVGAGPRPRPRARPLRQPPRRRRARSSSCWC